MHKPLYAVIGTTGVGKSELAVKLAKRLQGNVINGDSMQVYKGLDIITNKPNQMELSSAPHYLFDFLDPMNEYSVSEYVRDALEVIEHSHTSDNPPIIVGGTNYYIQALLWNKSIIQTASVPGLSNKASVKDSCHKSIDPELADTLCYLLENSDPRFNSAESIREFCECAPFHQTLMRVDPSKSNA
jgi:tRNA dimethylallyltransferase